MGAMPRPRSMMDIKLRSLLLFLDKIMKSNNAQALARSLRVWWILLVLLRTWEILQILRTRNFLPYTLFFIIKKSGPTSSTWRLFNITRSAPASWLQEPRLKTGILIFNHGIKAISERAAIMLWIRASRSIVVVFEYCHGMAMPPTQSQRSLNR